MLSNKKNNSAKMSLRRRLGLAAISYLTYPVRTDPSLTVFSQANGRYSDNSRALFEWMAKNGYNVRWLYEAVNSANHSTVHSDFFLYRKSFKGLWFAARAKSAVVSHGIHDFGPWSGIARRKKVVMLWHGIALKTLGIENPYNDPDTVKSETKYYNLVIASSVIDRYYTAAHQGVSVDRVCVTGLPRTDRMVRERRGRACSPDKFRVLYAPTFRDFDTGESSLFFPFDDYDEKQIVDRLSQEGIVVLLRPHPSDEGSLVHTEYLAKRHPEVFDFLSPSIVLDTSDLMSEVDAIVTDYSSIYLDLILFDVPCIFVPFDIQQYDAARGLAYNYETMTPGPKVFSQHHFLNALSSARNGASSWASHRSWVAQIFHEFQDDGACWRVAQAINAL